MMRSPIAQLLLAAGAFLAIGSSPLSAQDLSGRVVIYGRVEDAATREPVPGARVFSPDSSSVVLTDSAGVFGIPLQEDGPLAVYAERLGYMSQRFDLDASARSAVSVLLLEPAAIQIEGITAEAQSALTVLVERLEQRRNGYPHAMSAFDRSQLERFAPVGSVFDFVHVRVPRMGPCRGDRSQLCTPGRVRTVSNPYPELPVLVCVDGWKSIAPMEELSTLDISSAAILELYKGPAGSSGGYQVRVYTAQWLLSRARIGQTNVTPLWMGC